MIEKIIEYSVRNPLVILVAALGLTGWGVYAAINTPVDAVPDQSENQVIVFADWPGRSAPEVQSQVTYPLSVNLQGLAGVKTVRADSEFGFSMINVIFEDHIDFYFARQRVLERLSTAATMLPAGVTPYMAPDATALGQIYWYTVEGEGQDPGRLRAIQDWYVRYQLSSVPGVAEVASVGGFPIEYQIDIDPNKLRAYDVTLGELVSAVERSNSSVGGRVIQKANSEYLVRSAGWIQSLGDVEKTVIKTVRGTPIYVGTVATVQQGPAMRRASLEKNGSEAVGGVVLMRFGENPLAVTHRVKEKIEKLQAGLPEGVRIVPFYERTQLIDRSIETVTGTLREEIIVASLAIMLVLWHFGSALIVCITMPLAVLTAFILMRFFGVPSNIMSLSGIAISIGVLVDSSIVMVENATHHLHAHFGREKVHGNTRDLVLPALQTVGRPIFFSVVIMVISFIPVFALSGMEGRMFHPLAFTKTFAMVGVALLTITLVPALVPLLIRGRIRGEEESWLVRSVIEIYRPVLTFMLSHPWAIVWLTGLIFVVGAIPAESLLAGIFGATGGPLVTRLLIAVVVGVTLLTALADKQLLQRILGGVAAVAIVAAALFAHRFIKPLGQEFAPTLNEGSIMDMPSTFPRASITQVSDDLKARDALLRSYPEVLLVVGKAGRAETATDPAPLDMIETVVNLRPREHWPKRELRYDDAKQEVETVLAALEARGWIRAGKPDERTQIVNEASMFALDRFDRAMRDQTRADYALFEQQLAGDLTRDAVDETLRLLTKGGKLKRPLTPDEIASLAKALAPEFGPRLVSSADVVTMTQLSRQVGTRLGGLGAIDPKSDLFVAEPGPIGRLARSVGEALGLTQSTFFSELLGHIERQHDERFRQFVHQLDWRLFDRAAALYIRLASEEVRKKADALKLSQGQQTPDDLRSFYAGLEPAFARGLFLWQRSKDSLVKEMDTQVKMPGWGNSWTQPIKNRVDMLATGVRTQIGVKVYGDSMEKIQHESERIAEALKQIRGAADVNFEKVAGKGYLTITPDRQKAARYGVSIGDVQDTVDMLLGGKVITTTIEGRERFPVRIRLARDLREDEESVKNVPVAATGEMATAGTDGAMAAGRTAPSLAAGTTMLTAERPARPQIPLGQLADVRIGQGPAMIKSENGLLRAYVTANVRDRDVVGFVEEAQRVIDEQVKLPAGMYTEWTGEFEHQMRAKRTLMVIVPAVFLIIFLLLYITYHDLMDALLMMLAVPGAIAGGVLFQCLFGFNFSVAVWIGYIACFGLATETGVVMLVYLREAIDRRGGLANMSLGELREAVINGAVHRLRPKLLTEATAIIGLAPMLWATGTGAEIMRPMAAPVLGGILVADEVIDLLLPVLFYLVRARRWRKLHEATGPGAVQSEPAVVPS